jgi:hypothetical protein
MLQWLAAGFTTGIRQSRANAQTEAAETAAVESSDAPLPFDQPAEMHRSKRKVYAHWHFFPISFDNRSSGEDYFSRVFLGTIDEAGKPHAFGAYARERPIPRAPRRSAQWIIEDLEQDIRWASWIGIDAFLFNIINIDAKSEFWQLLRQMLTAAERVGSDFRVIPNIDASILTQPTAEEVAAALISVRDHPMWLKDPSGDLTLGAFMPEVWPIERWRRLLDALAQAGVRVRLLWTFLNVRQAPSDLVRLADIVSEWGGNFPDAVTSLAPVARYVSDLGKRWCAPVWPQDVRSKDGIYAEAANSRLFRAGWTAAIESGADHLQLITWNDYTEGSEIRPSTGIQYSFYDLAAFYVAWFKTGRQPRLVRDVLFYFHRVEPTSARRDASLQKQAFKLHGGREPVDQIELLAFLTAPGELEIELNGAIAGKTAPAGVTALYTPLGPGRPSFRLKRQGRVVIECASAFVISDRTGYQDLLYRGGSSARPVIAPDAQAAGKGIKALEIQQRD